MDNRRDLQDEPVQLAIRRESVVPTVSVLSASAADLNEWATRLRVGACLALLAFARSARGPLFDSGASPNSGATDVPVRCWHLLTCDVRARGALPDA